MTDPTVLEFWIIFLILWAHLNVVLTMIALRALKKKINKLEYQIELLRRHRHV